MAQPTLQEVHDSARSLLGDTAVPGGEVYTVQVLLEPSKAAVRDMWRCLANVAEPRVIREVYYVLPANTSKLDPSTASIADMKTPLIVEERGGLTQKTITNAVAGAGFLTVTATAHTFLTGDLITQNGIVGLAGTEGIWAITRVDDNSYKANGCVPTGTYTSGGVAVKSTNNFVQMDGVRRIDSVSSSPPRLREWAWRENLFHFQPSTEDRQLRIIYVSSATVPETIVDTVAVDDCVDFLGARTAALASKTRMPGISAELNREACGRSGEPDGSGGLLRSLIVASVKAMQRTIAQEREARSYREPVNY